MLAQVRRYIEEHDLFSLENDPLLVAVSGGQDSVALADVLHRLRARFAMAHCHFGLRGEEADADEQFVHKLAKKEGPVVIAATPLADLVAASTGRRGSAPVTAFDWYADTSVWSVVTEHRLADWVDGGGPPAVSLVDAVAREPVAFAALVDRYVAEQRMPTRALLARMGDWPDAELNVLVVGLLGTRRTTRLFVLDVLGARTPEVARPLLRRYWPEITRQADLSPTLAAVLEVAEDPKRIRWPWART